MKKKIYNFLLTKNLGGGDPNEDIKKVEVNQFQKFMSPWHDGKVVRL